MDEGIQWVGRRTEKLLIGILDPGERLSLITQMFLQNLFDFVNFEGLG